MRYKFTDIFFSVVVLSYVKRLGKKTNKLLSIPQRLHVGTCNGDKVTGTGEDLMIFLSLSLSLRESASTI
jgi:hypothetical protein